MEPVKNERRDVHLAVQWNWSYDTPRHDMSHLYEKAKREQWNATTDIPWDTQFDPRLLAIPEIAHPLHGTPMWEKLSQRERDALCLEQMSYQVNQMLHGEYLAALAISQLVAALPGLDAKSVASIQGVDEIRHTEVMSRYVREKLGVQRNQGPVLQYLLEGILVEPEWDMKLLGLYMLEVLARTVFAMMRQVQTEPLFSTIIDRFTDDEHRHIAFGALALTGAVGELGSNELRVREERSFELCLYVRDKMVPTDLYKDMGYDARESLAASRESPYMQAWLQMVFQRLVPALNRVGLLTPWVRERLDAEGLLAMAPSLDVAD